MQVGVVCDCWLLIWIEQMKRNLEDNLKYRSQAKEIDALKKQLQVTGIMQSWD